MTTPVLKRISLLIGLISLIYLSSCGKDATQPQAAKPAPAPVAATTADTSPKVPVKDVPAPDATKYQITIDNFTFTPQTMEVPVGTTVTWVNHDDIPHTVKSTENKFKSGTLDTDDTFSFTFTDAGTFDYFCTIHAHMTGKIIVK